MRRGRRGWLRGWGQHEDAAIASSLAVEIYGLESYMLGGHFSATQFLWDVEGHPEQPALRRALEELSFRRRREFYVCIRSRRFGWCRRRGLRRVSGR